MSELRLPRPDEPIAVTICTRNRPGYLASLLSSLVNQTYVHWSLVLNDQSDEPVVDVPVISDLLTLAKTRGHTVTTLSTPEPQIRYQEAMQAVPSKAEFILRIDDDVTLQPDFIEKLVRPFLLLPARPIAAAGPCLPDARMKPLPLASRLADDDWIPYADRPTWRLQGHAYDTRALLEVGSLWGSAICYRRSLAEAVGGWAVPGHSRQIFREDSDMSARWVAAGYTLVVSTEAVGHHFMAPSGGSREVERSPEKGNVITSDRASFEADDRLFRKRLETILMDATPPELKHYLLRDLEQGMVNPRPLATWKGKSVRLAGATARKLRRAMGR